MPMQTSKIVCLVSGLLAAIAAFSVPHVSQAQTPPTLTERQAAAAYLTPVGATTDVVLVNTGGADISFQVIGQTNIRTLAAGEEISLLALSIPTDITLYRTDGGFVRAQVGVEEGENTVRLELSGTASFSDDTSSVVILETGGIYLL